MDNAKRAQAIVDEAIRQVKELGCGLVADGTVDGNRIWFDSLRAVERQQPKQETAKPVDVAYTHCCGQHPCW